MVPHDARYISDQENESDAIACMDLDDSIIAKREQYNNINSISESSSGSGSGLFGEELEVKREVDTGGDSDAFFSFKKFWKYTGPGVVICASLNDPGNYEADLQTGATTGTKLLWVLLWAHVACLLFQLLSARLGTITGKHLAQLIRSSYSKHLTFVLWAFAQLAIIGADILEIVGTSIALHILLRLPLWAGVLMTATDTFTFMMIQRYGIRRLEAFFMVLVTVMAVCFWVELVQSNPDVGEIIKGVIVPIVPKNSEFQAVAMLGAIIMPHNMFLHSALVMSRDLGRQPSIRKLKEANFYFGIESMLAMTVSFLVNLAIVVVFAKVFYKPELIEAGTMKIPGLDDADVGLSGTLGSAAKYLWAAGLLASGQSSTMTGTLAGQYVTEGFFGNIFKKEWHRVAITRCISLVPGMLVAIFAVDHFDTMGEFLNVLQSVCLPTVLIPIIKLSSSPNVLSKEFRPSTILQVICWILTAIIILFDIFLFSKHATDLTSTVIIGIIGTVYLAFLVFLIWKPLNVSDSMIKSAQDGWMSLPQHDELDDEDSSTPALSLLNNSNRRNHSDDDAEEIYAL